jgi:hypothetical protein
VWEREIIVAPETASEEGCNKGEHDHHL